MDNLPTEVTTILKDFAPKLVYEELNKYIIGQDRAKKVLSVATFNRAVIFLAKAKGYTVPVEKSNILLIGPTGVGKTGLMKALSNVINCPLIVVDATEFTEEGYVGKSVNEILTQIIYNAKQYVGRKNYDGNNKELVKQLAELSIVYLDEVDKLSTRDTNGRDVSGTCVQEGLLTMVEGTEVYLNKTVEGLTSLNTSNILFIAGGAFPGLDKIIESRVSGNNMGFIKKSKNKQQLYPNAEDLTKYGLIPEFIGRFPVHVTLDDLTVKDLRRILIEPVNSLITQYKNLFAVYGLYLEFSDKALTKIAENAKSQKMGARALKNILESTLLEYQFNIMNYESGTTITIEAKDVIAR